MKLFSYFESISRNPLVRYIAICISFIFAITLSIGILFFYPEFFLALSLDCKIILLLSQVLVLFPFVLFVGVATWRRFDALPSELKVFWGMLSLAMTLGWLLTPGESVFPRLAALPVISRWVKGISISSLIDIPLFFFVCGVWLITLVRKSVFQGRRLDSISEKISLVHVAFFFCAYVVFSLLVGGPGILHPEMYVRMPVHLSGRPILQILFDALSMNLGGWDARQLSYFFDVIDGNFVAFCIRLGIPHFRSLTHYLFTLIIVIYLWYLFIKSIKIDRLLSLLMIALLLTTPSFVYAIYYRTSKIGVTLMLVILLGELYKTQTQNTYGVKRGKIVQLALIFFFSAVSLMLFDVLGVIFTCILIGYCFIKMLLKPDKQKLTILVGLILATAIWIVYFIWTGPALMLAITGQKADSSYLTGAPFQDLLKYLIWGIPAFFIDMIRSLFGWITRLQVIFILFLSAGVALRFRMQYRKREMVVSQPGYHPVKFGETKQNCLLGKNESVSRLEPFLSMFFLVGGILIAYDLLVTRHPPILLSEVRSVYYIMPAQAILLIGLSALLARPELKKTLFNPSVYPMIILFVLFLLAGNIIGTIRIEQLIYGGILKEAYTNTPILLDALRHLNSPGFIPNKSIILDRVYQLFLK